MEKQKKGFAVMPKEKVRAIAKQGGKAAHEKGTCHKFTPEEARIAGKKGGEIRGKQIAEKAALKAKD